VLQPYLARAVSVPVVTSSLAILPALRQVAADRAAMKVA
jgi:hypothetical protein